MKVINEGVDNLVTREDDDNNNNANKLIVGSTNGDTKSSLEIANNNGTSKLFSISELTSSLFLSGAPAVRGDVIEKLGVTCIISAAPELPIPPLPLQVSIILPISVQDSTSADIFSHLHRVADTIHEVSKNGGRTLVHCVAGVSRSATLCMGYLIKYRGMSLRKAFQHVRDCRPCIRPNSGFFRQLIDFEELVTGTTTVSMVHNSAARAVIPDVYEPDYYNTVNFQNNCFNRNFGRH